MTLAARAVVRSLPCLTHQFRPALPELRSSLQHSCKPVSYRTRTWSCSAAMQGQAQPHHPQYRFLATQETGVRCLAETLAQDLRPGDCYLLSGHVGAGKSTFCRAFIRAVDGDDMLTVPSPTYVLEYVYDEHEGPPLHHMDLYRLESPEECLRLGLSDALKTDVALVEWPEALGPAHTPVTHLAVDLRQTQAQAQRSAAALEEGFDQEERLITLVPQGLHWRDRLAALLPADPPPHWAAAGLHWQR